MQPLTEKMCPILSVATLSKVSMLHPGPGSTPKSPEAAPCQGDRCAWFVPITDSTGKVIDGSCAAALLPAGLSTLAKVILSTQPTPQEASNGST